MIRCQIIRADWIAPSNCVVHLDGIIAVIKNRIVGLWALFSSWC